MDKVLSAALAKAVKEGWSDTELAARLGESPQTLHNWKKRGGIPKEKWIDVVVRLGLDVRSALPELIPVIAHAGEDNFEGGPELVYVNRIDGVHLSAGTGEIIWDSEEIYRVRAFELDWMQAEGYNPDRCKVFHVRGDSMEPAINSGDAVMVNMAQREPLNGEVFALVGEDGLRVKRLHKRGGGVYMHSDNQVIPGRYPDEPIVGNYAILGQVVWKAGKVR